MSTLTPLPWYDPRGRTPRHVYLVLGFGLAVIKYRIDLWTGLRTGLGPWGVGGFWQARSLEVSSDVWALVFAQLLTALPFIAVGVIFTLRRLRDASLPLWWVFGVFLPAVNLLLFLVVGFLPAPDRLAPAETRRSRLYPLVRRLAGENAFVSATLAAVLAIVLAVAMTWLATVFFKNYGQGVFMGMPFMLGLIAAVAHGAATPRTLWGCVGAGQLAILFSALAILAVALEGLICLLMAAPIASIMALLGSIVGFGIQHRKLRPKRAFTKVYSAGWIGLPLLLAGESAMPPEPQVIPAVTSVDIAASPLEVWREVVAFSELAPPEELIFRSGIAYPIRATISGMGVGAVRHCEFSTGPFVEPITVWDEGKRLAFDVVEQPHPMRELSPYRHLHTAHLEGFFLSLRGEFLLISLPDGHARLQGTTWYTQRFWPAGYWRLWSDYLLHSIHRRVLNHIRTQVERYAAPRQLTPQPSNP